MNSMNASFAGGVIRETDYFDSADRDQGLAWLVMDHHAWHVLLPDRCARRPREAFARPVIARDEPDGWRWRLELGDWHLPPRLQRCSNCGQVPTAQITCPHGYAKRCWRVGSRPPLPEPRSRSARTCPHGYAQALLAGPHPVFQRTAQKQRPELLRHHAARHSD